MFQVIEQASGCSDHNIRAGFQFLSLPAVSDAAKYDGGFQIGEARVIVERGFHLGGEFTCGFENEHTRPDRMMLAEFRQDGKGEGGGFSGAGLCAADDVTPGQHEGNCAELNGSRVHITHGFDTVENDL